MALTDVLDVRVYGQPLAQRRPRVRVVQPKERKPFAHVYEDPADKDWKRTVILQVLPKKPPAPVEGPLAMTLRFFLPRPISLPARERYHTRKPDLSNLAKSVEDALRGIVYRDDAQLVRLTVEKHYDPAPGVAIQIERVVAQLELAR